MKRKKPAKKINAQQTLTRRMLIIGGVKIAAVSTLLGRLYYLQCLKRDEYSMLAEDNRVHLDLIAPLRGEIMDRNSVVLASNRTYYRLLMVRDKTEATYAMLAKLQELIELSSNQKRRIEKEVKNLPKGRIILIKDYLSWEEISKLEFHKSDLPNLVIESSQTRDYPLASYASHILGYVGRVSKTEQKEEEPVLSIPDFKIGKNGIEKSRESYLRGAAGIKQIEVNVNGVPVRELSRKNAVQGNTEKLTIDSRLQTYAAERIGEESAGIVVMDIQTGDVLTLTSMPSFDPNVFSLGIPSDYWKSLNENPKTPLLNKVITGQYPPGSTFKMCVGLAALEHKVTTPNETVFCNGTFYLGSKPFRCWKPEGHGSVNITGAIAQSCDTYFYTMGRRLGITPYADVAKLLGLGQTHNIGIPNEKAGILPTPEWKKAAYNQDWYPGDTINASIGQGYHLATPLQLMVMTARLASGRNVSPRLFTEVPLAEFSPLPFQEENLALIRQGMSDVCNSPRGTAYRSRIDIAGFELAGKTGTAQVRHLVARGMDQNKLPWEFRHHALFVGFAPVHAPRYAAALIVEHGGGGASAAAPILSDVLKQTQLLLSPPPANLSAPEPTATILEVPAHAHSSH
jgi:penicillin-binding protein 2